MIAIRKLIWDQRNIFHIARHYIVPEEVEDVCHGEPIVQRGIKRKRLILLGLTSDDRLLNIVLENKGRGIYYPITAFDASRKDKVLYKKLRGGEKK